MNIRLAVLEGTNILKDSFIKTAKLDTEILMAKALGKNREYVVLNNNKTLKEKNLNHFKELIQERATKKPIAYLLNKKCFWKDEFYLNRETLIPRPDTETIIEQVLKITKNKSKLRVLDIGIGSGCILLSVLKEKKIFMALG